MMSAHASYNIPIYEIKVILILELDNVSIDTIEKFLVRIEIKNRMIKRVHMNRNVLSDNLHSVIHARLT